MRKFACLLVATLLFGLGCGSDGGSDPTKPVANAGTSRTVPVNVPAQLDGSRSASPNGGLLAYQWTLQSKPVSSTSTLNSRAVANPTFLPDTTGPYVLQLVVNDGIAESAVSSVTITAVAGNIPPVADAGPDQLVAFPISIVRLDGGGSRDANGDLITTYLWRTISRPAGSNPVLSELSYTDRVDTDFTPDVAGTYLFGLIVTDNNAAISGEDNVTVTVQAAGNVPPVADAGPDQNVVTGALVTLDGSGSYDPNPADDPLIHYSWSMISRPSGSGATLSVLNPEHPTFTADVSGSYVFALVVSDPSTSSDPSTVTISADRLASISVAPLDCVTTLGFSVQYTALGSYEIAGQKVNLTEAVTWTSDNTSIATIDATGFAVTASGGVTIIRASYAGVSPFSTTLRVGQVVLQSVEIKTTKPRDLIALETAQLQLLGYYSDGSVIDLTKLADWSRSYSYASILNVSNIYDNKGFVSTFGTGTAQVHATYQGFDAVITVNVTN